MNMESTVTGLSLTHCRSASCDFCFFCAVLLGLVIPPKTSKDEEQNVGLVLQILEDVLGVSLSHINPKDIVNQNEVAIGNMLQVFSGFVDGW